MDTEYNSFSMDWRSATGSDLGIINRIADEIHVGLPEREEVFNEKFYLFPKGYFVLMQTGIVVGYGVSHPWLLYDIPPLDQFLGMLPSSPDCLYLHDIAILPSARGHGSVGSLIELIISLARQRQIAFLALVSVYNTHALWARYGFEVASSKPLTEKLRSYGDTARYMVRKLN